MKAMHERLRFLLAKEGNTATEIEEIGKFEEVLDIQNVGRGQTYHPDHEQINIIISFDDNRENDEAYFNYKIEELDNKLQAVSGFKCTDGIILENLKDANDHQREIDRVGEVDEFIKEHCYNGMDKDNVKDLLTEHREELLKILS